MSETTDVVDEFFEPVDPVESTEEQETEGDTAVETSTEGEETEAEDQSAEESEESNEETEDESTESDEEATKRHNAEMAQRRIAERDARQKGLQELAVKQQKYLEDADTEAELRIRQLEVNNQNAQIEQYERVVNGNEQTIVGDHSRILSDPDTQLFNPESEQYNKRQMLRMRRAYEAENLVVDQNGKVIQVKGSFYNYAKEWASDWKADMQVAEGRAGKTVKRNLAKSAPTGNSTGKLPAKSDPILEILTSDD